MLNNSFEKKKFMKILFSKYTFPIEYNKRNLDLIFEKILYFFHLLIVMILYQKMVKEYM